MLSQKNQQVHVSGNELGQAGGEAMAAALRANDTLETLEIGNVVLGAKVKIRSNGEIKVVTDHSYIGDIKVEGDLDVRLKHSTLMSPM